MIDIIKIRSAGRHATTSLDPETYGELISAQRFLAEFMDIRVNDYTYTREPDPDYPDSTLIKVYSDGHLVSYERFSSPTAADEYCRVLEDKYDRRRVNPIKPEKRQAI